MAKQSGLGDYLFFNGVDLSNDIQSLSSISSPRGVFEVPGINSSAMERIYGLRDGQMSFVPYFNDAATHGELATLPTGDRVVTYCRGYALGQPSACMSGKQINYDGTRAQDGMLTFSVDAMANGSGLEWGLTFGELTHSGATNSASINHGSATTFGWSAYLQVYAFDGTDMTVTVQESSDNGSGDAWASLGAFTAATGTTAERITGTGDVEQYVRIASSGTFTSATFTVTFVRHGEAQ